MKVDDGAPHAATGRAGPSNGADRKKLATPRCAVRHYRIQTLRFPAPSTNHDQDVLVALQVDPDSGIHGSFPTRPSRT